MIKENGIFWHDINWVLLSVSKQKHFCESFRMVFLVYFFVFFFKLQPCLTSQKLIHQLKKENEKVKSVPPIGCKPILVNLSKSWLIAMRPWVVIIMEDIFFHKWEILLSISYKCVEFSINFANTFVLVPNFWVPYSYLKLWNMLYLSDFLLLYSLTPNTFYIFVKDFFVLLLLELRICWYGLK